MKREEMTTERADHTREEEPLRELTTDEAWALIQAQERRLRRIQYLSLGWWALFLIGGGIIYHSFPITLGIFLGGLIVVLNFFWLTRLVRRAFQKKEKPTKGFFVKFGLKFFLLLAIVAFVIYFTPVNPIAFLIGLSVSVCGIMLDGAIGVVKKIA